MSTYGTTGPRSPRHRQAYRLTSKHRAFIDALYDLECASPGKSDHAIGEIVAHAGLDDNAHEPISAHTARRLSEGLTSHGYVRRTRPGHYSLTAKGRKDSAARGPQDAGQPAPVSDPPRADDPPNPGGIAGGVMDGTYDTPFG